MLKRSIFIAFFLASACVTVNIYFPAAAVERLALANRLPPNQFEYGYMPTLVNTGRELVLFDTGNGAPRRGLRA